jgi:hypothetical protein
MRHLHVCLVTQGRHANCCRCEKCVRTILSFRAAGIELPPTFEEDVSLRHIRNVRLHSQQTLRQWQEILSGAQRQGLGTTEWAKALNTAIRRNQIREEFKRIKRPFVPLRNRLRKVLRGSPLNRSKLDIRAKATPQAG